MTTEHVDKVLHSAFDVNQHVETFINYCEVIIWPDGKIEYAVPSHNQKLIEVYAQLRGIDIDDAITEIRREFPGEGGIDNIMKMTGIISVWYDYIYNVTRLTSAQHEALKMLLEHNCISASCFESFQVL